MGGFQLGRSAHPAQGRALRVALQRALVVRERLVDLGAENLTQFYRKLRDFDASPSFTDFGDPARTG